MATILIPRKISVDEVEELYSTDPNWPLRIPNSYKSLRIGLISRLAQFFITRGKQNNTPIHFPWIELGSHDKKKAIVEDPLCLTAVLMASEVQDAEGHPIKKMLTDVLIERFDIPVFRKGRQIQMYAVDHSIEKYAKPECFYTFGNEHQITQSPSYYFELLKSYFNHVAKDSRLSIPDYIGICELLAELVDNTDQHALSDYTRGISERSVRAMVLNCHLLVKDKDASDVCGTDNPIANYIGSLRPNNETLNLLEISIFDSGPGVYRSFPDAQPNPSILEESELVLSCFKNGVTSKINGIGVGRGLDKAKLILNNRGGFLSIRTGRLGMYRDYLAAPIENTIDSERPDIELFDEKTSLRNNFSEMTNVEGVSYTILVPLQ